MDVGISKGDRSRGRCRQTCIVPPPPSEAARDEVIRPRTQGCDLPEVDPAQRSAAGAALSVSSGYRRSRGLDVSQARPEHPAPESSFCWSSSANRPPAPRGSCARRGHGTHRRRIAGSRRRGRTGRTSWPNGPPPGRGIRHKPASMRRHGPRRFWSRRRRGRTLGLVVGEVGLTGPLRPLPRQISKVRFEAAACTLAVGEDSSAVDRHLRTRPNRPHTGNQPWSRSASTTASLMSACFVAVSSVRARCLARSRRC